MPSLKFTELPDFTARCRREGLVDADLRALQNLLLANPDVGPVMAGTGGLRKLRYGRAGRGKSGDVRVAYAHFPRYATVVFVAVFGKSDQANLTAAEKAVARRITPALEADAADDLTASRRR